MPIQFPPQPWTIGQVYNSPEGEAWEFNGDAWQSLGFPSSTGPAGPQGPTGPRGATGNTGPYSDFYFQSSSPIPNPPDLGARWIDNDTGVEYIWVFDGSGYLWMQDTLPIGPQGPQGVSGVNNIDLLTTTPLSGLLKGNGSTVEATTVVTELGYTPENVANKSIDPTFSANSDTLYPSQKAVKTALDSFSDDVDYAIMSNQQIIYNL